MTPKRIQRQRTRGWRKPENTVYVGRGTDYGNPYKIGIDGDRDKCLELYDSFVVPSYDIEQLRKDLKGKNLMCFCPLSESCHTSILLQLANS